MGFFKKLFGLEKNIITLITATIQVDSNHNYCVTFSNQYPQLQTSEYVRLLLHYYAKLLYNFDPSSSQDIQSSIMLKTTMDKIVSIGVSKDTKILEIIDLSEIAKINSKPSDSASQIVATLFSVDATKRRIETYFSNDIYSQQAVISVFVLLQAIQKTIDVDCIEILNKSLKNMQEKYNAGESYSDDRNCFIIPIKAFIEAISR